VTQRAHVIIGANYGDEGKGLATDYICAKEGADVVVRFNGGAQAGHTVVLPSGERHVFHHFGAGTFAGATTFLSKHFVCNPALFVREWQALNIFRKPMSVFVDHQSTITTPYDMLYNQEIENLRSDGRHGSCGVGFGATVGRNAHVRLSLSDLKGAANTKAVLQHVRDYYKELCLADCFSVEAIDRITKYPLDQWYQDLNMFLRVVIMADIECLNDANCIVFEGAQGLALDQAAAGFPHVTRSSTGLKNVIEIANQLELTDLDVHYVTRTYFTRHGAGPLPDELPGPPWPTCVDTTNVTHPFQGSLRYAAFDSVEFAGRVQKDLSEAVHAGDLKINPNPNLFVTCCDQVPGGIDSDPALQLAEAVTKVSGPRFENIHGSFGATRADVRSYGPYVSACVQNAALAEQT
jgi:adenylosuccinate synthase